MEQTIINYWPYFNRTIGNTNYDTIIITTQDDIEILREYFSFFYWDGYVLVRDEATDDNGILKTTEYLSFDFFIDYDYSSQYDRAATRQLVTYEDLRDVTTWESIEISFDIDDLPALQTTVFDNGRIRTAVFEAGVAQYAMTVDYNDAHNWAEKIEYFDSDGVLSEVATVYDDGSVFADYFANGVLVDTLEFTSQDEWNAGRIPEQAVVETSFPLSDGGTLVLQEDAAVNLKDWSTIETTYDASGQITERFIVYDNYLEAVEHYENGVLVLKELDDRDDAYGYDNRELRYENGELVSFYQQNDTLDGVEKFYDESGLVYKIEKHVSRYDVPSQSSYLEQVTFYDPNGTMTYRAENWEPIDAEKFYQYDADGDVLIFAFGQQPTSSDDDYGVINFYDEDGDYTGQIRYETEAEFEAGLLLAFDDAPLELFQEIDAY